MPQRGRPRAIDDDAAIRATFAEVGQNARRAAKRLGVAYETARNYAKRLGIPLKIGRPKDSRWHFGALATWLREHPGIVLPRRVKKIALLTGCAPQEISDYLYRRRRDARRRMMKVDVATFRAIGGYPTRALKDLTTQLDPYTFLVKVHMVFRNGVVRDVSLPLEHFEHEKLAARRHSVKGELLEE